MPSYEANATAVQVVLESMREALHGSIRQLAVLHSLSPILLYRIWQVRQWQRYVQCYTTSERALVDYSLPASPRV